MAKEFRSQTIEFYNENGEWKVRANVEHGPIGEDGYRGQDYVTHEQLASEGFVLDDHIDSLSPVYVAIKTAAKAVLNL